jgi:predicted AAA+ superfamily ATPase
MILKDEAMKKIMNSRINFFLYGPRASGKTYYLKGLLD